MSKHIPRCLLLALLCGNALAYAETNPESGKMQFEQRCASCHGAAAVGIEGISPPLQNMELWQALGKHAEVYIAGVMTGGMSGTISVAGQDYRGMVMPPQAHVDSGELANIAAYVVKTLNAGSVSPDTKLIDELKAAPMSHQALRALRKTSITGLSTSKTN